MEGMARSDSGKQAQGCGESWEVRDHLNGGDQGQTTMALEAEVATNGGDAGMWVAAEGSVCPEISVVPISGWMEGALYHLTQTPNMKVRGLDLEKAPKSILIERGMVILLERLLHKIIVMMIITAIGPISYSKKFKSEEATPALTNIPLTNVARRRATTLLDRDQQVRESWLATNVARRRATALLDKDHQIRAS